MREGRLPAGARIAAYIVPSVEAGSLRSRELRPLGVGETLDAAIAVYTQNAGTFIRITLVVIVPLQVLAVLVTGSLAPSPRVFDPTSGFTGQSQPLDGAYIAGTLILALAQIPFTLIAFGACFKAAGEAYLGGRAGWRDSLAFAARRVLSLLLIALLVGGALAVVAIVALVVGGLVAGALSLAGPIGLVVGVVLLFLVVIAGMAPLAVYWSVAIPALLAEDARGSRALGRSLLLVRGRWWASFAVLGVATLLLTIGQVLIGGVPLAFLFTDSGDSVLVAAVVSATSNGVAYALLMPVLACAVSILYFDLRVRKEGLDLALMARGMDDHGSPTAAPGAQPLATTPGAHPAATARE